MARVVLIVLFIGVTVYALLDWWMNSKRRTPGGISRWIWLAVIVVIPFLGPLTWIIMRIVGDAEERQGLYDEPEPAPGAPDDDAAFLDDVSKKIERRQGKPGREDPRPRGNTDDAEADSGDEATDN